jgi:ABC-type multidrug transport system fused ATPase/permease subunit
LIVLGSGVGVAFRAGIFNTMSERIALKLRNDYFISCLSKDIAFFDERRTGVLSKKLFLNHIVSKLNSDIMVIQDTMSSHFSIFTRSLFVVVASFAFMFYLSPILAGVQFATMLPLFLFFYFFGNKMRLLAKEVSKNKGVMATVAEESFGNVRTVKAFANEDEECEKFKKGNLVVKAFGIKKALW